MEVDADTRFPSSCPRLEPEANHRVQGTLGLISVPLPTIPHKRAGVTRLFQRPAAQARRRWE
jgi:hypothetical protein